MVVQETFYFVPGITSFPREDQGENSKICTISYI